jgi:hypothetical protein
MPVKIEGLAELQRKMNTLRASKRKAIVRKAITKANRPIVQKAKAIAPRSNNPVQGRKRFRMSLGSKVHTIKNTEVIVGIVGQASNRARSSRLDPVTNRKRAVNIHLVEGRTKAHWIEPMRRSALQIGRGRRAQYYSRIYHPGQRGQPFLSRVQKATQAQALRITEYEMKKEAAKIIGAN